MAVRVAQARRDGLVDAGEDLGAGLVVAGRPEQAHGLLDRERQVVATDDPRGAALGERGVDEGARDLPAAARTADDARLLPRCPYCRADSSWCVVARSDVIECAVARVSASWCCRDGEPTAPLGVARAHAEDRGELADRVPRLLERRRRTDPLALGAARRAPGRKQRLARRRVVAADERGELGPIDVAGPPRHPVPGAQPRRVGVVGDGPALWRGELDNRPGAPSAGQGAAAFEVLDDGHADGGRGPVVVPERGHRDDHGPKS